MAGPGFAVVDVETTGLFPGGHDRVVEIAIVHTDELGRVTDRFETLVNPERDMGPQRIHGIQAAEVLDAPTIQEIASDIVGLLDGRVPVAHNASFDSRFIAAELGRAGVQLNPEAEYLCTMQLARRFLPGAGRSLSDCCAAYDIEIVSAHRALDDALATATLLESYILDTGQGEFWTEHLDRARDRRWQVETATFNRWMPRPASSLPLSTAAFLDRITSKLPDLSGPDEHREYLAYLDRALLDRHISVHEARGLAALANELAIDRSAVETLHVAYFNSVATTAWADGVLTESELADLALVADLLEVSTDHLTRALEPVSSPSSEHFALRRGDVVVLTGEMTRPRSAIEADLVSHGLIPSSAVSKKVALVVAADPDSQSGKARKARDYGLPVIGEHALAGLMAGV